MVPRGMVIGILTATNPGIDRTAAGAKMCKCVIKTIAYSSLFFFGNFNFGKIGPHAASLLDFGAAPSCLPFLYGPSRLTIFAGSPRRLRTKFCGISKSYFFAWEDWFSRRFFFCIAALPLTSIQRARYFLGAEILLMRKEVD